MTKSRKKTSCDKTNKTKSWWSEREIDQEKEMGLGTHLRIGILFKTSLFVAPRAELRERHYPWQITTLPLWSSHGTLGCLKTWPSGAYSAHKKRGHWQILGLAHRGGIHTWSGGGWWQWGWWWRGFPEMRRNHLGKGWYEPYITCQMMMSFGFIWSLIKMMDLLEPVMDIFMPGSARTCMCSTIWLWNQDFNAMNNNWTTYFFF